MTHVAWLSLGQFNPRVGVGGMRSTLSRLRALREQGYPVSILDFLANDQDHEGFDRLLSEYGGGLEQDGSTCRCLFAGLSYVHQVLPRPWFELIRQQQPAVGAIVAALRREGVEYTFTFDEGLWPLQATWRARVPGAHFFQTAGDVRRFARNPGYIWLLKHRTVVATSRFMQGLIGTHLGLDSLLWYPCIDLRAYRQAAHERGLGRIGFSATGGAKGWQVVEQVARRLPERQFVVAGHGVRTDGRGLPENVMLLGHIADMQPFYAQIDLLLVPSMVEEAFGRVVIEAAAAGIPSVANCIGGLPEALGDSGALVEVRDDIAAMAEAYVGAIAGMLGTPDSYARERQRALARAAAYEHEQHAAITAFCARELELHVGRPSQVGGAPAA